MPLPKPANEPAPAATSATKSFRPKMLITKMYENGRSLV